MMDNKLISNNNSIHNKIQRIYYNIETCKNYFILRNVGRRAYLQYYKLT